MCHCYLDSVSVYAHQVMGMQRVFLYLFRPTINLDAPYTPRALTQFMRLYVVSLDTIVLLIYFCHVISVISLYEALFTYILVI